MPEVHRQTSQARMNRRRQSRRENELLSARDGVRFGARRCREKFSALSNACIGRTNFPVLALAWDTVQRYRAAGRTHWAEGAGRREQRFISRSPCRTASPNLPAPPNRAGWVIMGTKRRRAAPPSVCGGGRGDPEAIRRRPPAGGWRPIWRRRIEHVLLLVAIKTGDTTSPSAMGKPRIRMDAAAARNGERATENPAETGVGDLALNDVTHENERFVVRSGIEADRPIPPGRAF